MGGGSESSANYQRSEVKFVLLLFVVRSAVYSFNSPLMVCFDTVPQVIFLGIDNIHGMRDSLTKMREFLDTHGACSSDGSSSLLVCKVPYLVALRCKRLVLIGLREEESPTWLA